MSNKPLAIAIMGPTASGKTALSIRLAEQLNGEIISVDSALVYRGLNIGAAKPTLEERAGIVHWLIDIQTPEHAYSAAEFRADALDAMSDIIARGKVPILAGGTMLYFKALLEGLSNIPTANIACRQEIEQEAAARGWPAIHEELAKVDPVSAERIHPNHSQRLSRALEVWRSTGKPMSDWQVGFQGGALKDYAWVQFAIAPSDRTILHQRIAKRFELMLDAGFLEEVKALRMRQNLHKDLPAIRAVGYRQAWEYLDGDYDFELFRHKAIVATRQLAKRQLTWLRAWPALNWVDTHDIHGNVKEIEKIVEQCLNVCAKRAI